MGHKGNSCQTEYGAATWRTTWPWQRSAISDCFLVIIGFSYIYISQGSVKKQLRCGAAVGYVTTTTLLQIVGKVCQ